MRRLLCYTALLGVAVLGWGCALTDYNYWNTPSGEVPPLADSHLTHMAVQCHTWDKMPGENTQQWWEKGVREFDRVAYPGAGFCSATTVGKPTAEEAREWTRFLGTWTFQAELMNYGSGCQAGLFTTAGVKGLDDGTVRIFTLHWGIWTTYRWTCGGLNNYVQYQVGPEASVFGDEVQGFYPPAVAGTVNAPVGPWVVAIDKANGAEFQQNFAAFNFSQAGPYNCNNCMSILVSTSRGYEGNLTEAPLKGAAGLAEFFNGQEAMTLNMGGLDLSFTGHLEDSGKLTLSFLSVGNGSSMVDLSNDPVRLGVNSRTWRQFTLDSAGQVKSLAKLGTWWINNMDPKQSIHVGGYIPELGIHAPQADILVNPEAIRYFIAQNTSGIDPRGRR